MEEKRAKELTDFFTSVVPRDYVNADISLYSRIPPPFDNITISISNMPTIDKSHYKYFDQICKLYFCEDINGTDKNIPILAYHLGVYHELKFYERYKNVAQTMLADREQTTKYLNELISAYLYITQLYSSAVAGGCRTAQMKQATFSVIVSDLCFILFRLVRTGASVTQYDELNKSINQIGETATIQIGELASSFPADIFDCDCPEIVKLILSLEYENRMLHKKLKSSFK